MVFRCVSSVRTTLIRYARPRKGGELLVTQEVRPVNAVSVLKYDPRRVSEIALSRIDELRPEPIYLREANGDIRMNIRVHPSTDGPGKRIVGTAQAKAVGVHVRTAKQEMPEGCDLGSNRETDDRSHQIGVRLG